jgi:hypothetical protein
MPPVRNDDARGRFAPVQHTEKMMPESLQYRVYRSLLKILKKRASSEPGRTPAADSTIILGIIAQK